MFALLFAAALLSPAPPPTATAPPPAAAALPPAATTPPPAAATPPPADCRLDHPLPAAGRRSAPRRLDREPDAIGWLALYRQDSRGCPDPIALGPARPGG